ncbi:Calcium-transporting ATPase 3 [Daldinia childiae]|uniref:Calcium-transporting ATPase 3 n=1 Tax=Daldinia childiae TaxID=326645 RepID=UPI0014471D1E|nr:Calcium-transporting ATPase 3 [Daldinia childiae]KAF3061115.1 Calcium-transporting ATPase 3 [Daldinia childiae]
MAGQFERHPFLLTAQDVAKELETDLERGLSSAKVTQLQEKYPPNELDVGGAIPGYKIFLKQLFNAMILILFLAMGLSFGMSDWVEGGVLLAVIVLNVSIGFYQEYGAEKKLDALRALSAPSAMVLRDGRTRVIPNAEVVPGDIVILKMGDTVPADIRLFEAMNLAADEQSLTGESVPVEKIVEHLEDDDLGIGDRINIAYGTTTIRKGRGRGVVISTGMQTEVGKIAASTAKKHRKAGRSMNYKKYGKRQPIIGLFRRIYDFIGKFLGLTEGTPLQIKLAKLAYVLFGCALLLAVIVFAVNKFSVDREVVIYAISTGIAIIPESLVAVLTITMVVAVTVMRKTNVVVRNLSALEALGGVTNICSDKTGTLTQGAMIVRKVWIPSKAIYTVEDSKHPSNPSEGRVTFSEVDDQDQEPEKRDFDQERSAAVLKFDVPDEKLNPPRQKKEDEKEATMNPKLEAFLLSAALCNLATVRHEPEPSDGRPEWQVTGEPTEIALQVFSYRFQKGKKIMEAEGWKQVAEFPFDSGIKRMSVVYNGPNLDHSMVFTKGAVERVIDLCSTVGTEDSQEPMTEEYKERILKQMDVFASQGQRVLAIASRPWEGKYQEKTTAENNEGDDPLRKQVESGLTLLGLAGIYDPPRKETTPAIAECSTAGIKVHMLTGDHPATAEAIAKEVGIIPRNLGVLSHEIASAIVQKASDFDKLSDDEIDALPELPLVLARCAPDTKTRMIEALRRRSAYMAMTGDGVNDAPSLSRADVGIAMGSGSDVAKSAAKIVLTDDKFNSIVAAIREGRRMFDNIQKFILHLLTSNVGEVILLICGLGFQDETGLSVFPISPLEILWINMVTSSFPAFGLGREPASREVMRKPPHDRKRGVFTNQILVDMLVYGLLMGTLSLMSFVIVIYGVNGGQLGVNCNREYGPDGLCEPVFRARATVFAELTWLILISAWEFKDIRRSMFRLNPDDSSKFPLFKDVYENKFLFWAVVLGAISVFPVVYIPTINTNVFKHIGISWEWSLVVVATIIFVAGVELWKLAKRHFRLLEDAAVVRGAFSQGSEEGSRKFHHTFSFSSLKSWRSIGQTHTTDTRASTKERKDTSPV